MASVMENGILNMNRGDLWDVDRIGFVDDMIIWIWTDDPDSSIPHVHVVDRKTGGSRMNACVQLGKSAYLNHGSGIDELNESQRAAFDKFMREFDEYVASTTNYELTLIRWNSNNPKSEIDIPKDANGNVVIPNYRTIAKE